MTLQERIDFILNNNFPATVKRKHLVYLMQHLGDYSENADELGEAHATICEALEQLDIEIGGNPMIDYRPFDRNRKNKVDDIKEFENWLKDNKKPVAKEFKSRKYDKGADGSLTKDLLNSLYGKFNTTQPLTVTELDRTLEFFLTYNILSMQQVQEIRTKAAAYLR